MNTLIISTIGSHSALQILYGAKQEGFNTKVYCLRGREELYKRYPVAQEIILLDSYEDLLNLEPANNEIFIPHGTLIATLGKRALDIQIPVFGNKEGMHWEMVRENNLKLLKEANIRTPKSYQPDEIDKLVIVKFPGAKGGLGYFICSSQLEFEQRISEHLSNGLITKEDAKLAQIQEYVVGVTMYPHYFHSVIHERVEMLGIDRRYETNADALGRLSQENYKIDPTYKVVGNQPLIARESLLPEILECGDRLVDAAARLFSPGLLGPFCIEMSITPEEIVAFEFTSRIVAGTTLYTNGSPYSQFLFDENMSMARRIGREIKQAMGQRRLRELLT
ncbi:MAG: formate--phosphoribosylaminoimidazolecarboxamide ligase [Candidatus Heimdallarchaeota archaeon]|nr:formate--phosphoribosylaminoimidazolecarboxamide ligase [Candidatus Heimdallarchaeota archaeon]